MHLASIEITQRCDGTCRYCAQPKAPRDLTPRQLRNLLAELAREQIDAVAFGGGEPTQHPQLRQLLEICREQEMPVGLTTNAEDPSVILAVADDGLLTRFGVSAGKGRWLELVGHANAVANLLLLRKGASRAMEWFTEAVHHGCRCVLMMTYKGHTTELRPCLREVSATFAVLSAACRRAGVLFAVDDCTRRRLSLSPECGRGFMRINLDGSRWPCCFPDCEFYPPYAQTQSP